MRGIYIECIGTHVHGRQVTSLLCLSDVFIFYYILAYSGTSWSLLKNSGEQEKIIYDSCEGRIEKSVPRDHRLSSLVIPNGDPQDGFFYPTLILHCRRQETL